MFHYQIINSLDNQIVLDSGNQRAFIGYPTSGVAYMVGLGKKIENRLSDLHKVITYNKDLQGADSYYTKCNEDFCMGNH